ncbi:Ribosomal protein L24 [Elusimicrobium minutum Pei191]|uniref:Large ribosomal subunit protein uL24 n=1 Tax=Elusimicrobium minutum (strain Pei191) TaxID=445932 RepID=RL24_ELUMP|nr:50S ribosomal protein L24 [Elusimicrobium minutum]B2KEL0.1 RecName: Full=Large ribosomal subunit protein uL24; AltName: Full=50S ribosomal protein L24 [Elusimicrobium minutum Pei191]ACC98956.1 Ribosomal protein L24 [Elusimicrobium minutum Pei191]
MLKKNDSVVILSGKDKGKKGEIKEVIASKNRVIVSGVNIVSKHEKPAGNKKGGIIKVEAPLHISNVAIVCKKCNKAMTPKHTVANDGAKVRVCRKCGETVK